MDFDNWEGGVGEGVAEGEAVMGEGARIDDYAVGVFGLGLEEIDYCTLVVGLEERYVCAELGGAGGNGSLNIGEGGRPVLGRVPLAETIEVGAVYYQYSHSESLEARALGWAFS